MDLPFKSLGECARLFEASKGKNAFSFAFVPPCGISPNLFSPSSGPGLFDGPPTPAESG